MAIKVDSSRSTSSSEYFWVFVDWLKARCIEIDGVAFLVRTNDRLARGILCERSYVSFHVSSSKAVSGTVYRLIGFNIYSRTLLFLHYVVLVSHQNCIVAWVRKLLPVINMVFFKIALIESLGFNCLSTWQIRSCEVSPGSLFLTCLTAQSWLVMLLLWLTSSWRI